MIFWLLIAISGIYYAINFNLKYKKTKLEDVNFNKNYIVKTDNEVEARYFLTTGFMERFKKLQTVFGKKNISCCAEKDIIRFTISKKDNPFDAPKSINPNRNGLKICARFNKGKKSFS